MFLIVFTSGLAVFGSAIIYYSGILAAILGPSLKHLFVYLCGFLAVKYIAENHPTNCQHCQNNFSKGNWVHGECPQRVIYKALKPIALALLGLEVVCCALYVLFNLVGNFGLVIIIAIMLVVCFCSSS